MFYLLFIFYLVLFCWLIPRIGFFKDSGLSKFFLIGLFLTRLAAALIYGYILVYYYPLSDVAHFQTQGIQEFHLLFNHPYEYLTNIFQNHHSKGYGNFLESSDSYWNDTRSNLIEKMLSIFDMFSGTNYFINTIFYNFLVFFGGVALYRVFINVFPSEKTALIVCIFLLPSAIFFSSAIHRDGLILLSLSMVIYHLYFMMKTKTYPIKKILITLFFLLLILLIRNFVFITIVPALVAWIVAQQKPRYAFQIFAGIYLFLGVLFFLSALLPNAYNLPAHVSSRQLEFSKLAKNGGSSININPLYPNFRSFINNLPQAFNHSFMRPYITEFLNFFYIPSGIEIIFYEILFLLFIFSRKRKIPNSPVIYFSVFFSGTMFLVIGYTIPIIGAIVRYRSIYFPLIMIPIVCNIDWQRIKNRMI